MNKYLILFLFFFVTTVAHSQTKSFILNGGWAVALPNNSDVAVNGFKIGAHWEKAIIQEHVGWGIEADYINFKQIGSKTASNSVNKLRTIPLTFYGKYLIGNDKLQGYAKVGAGIQFTKVSSETPNLYVSDNDFGIALTAGAGVYYTLTEYLYLNLDYGFLYLSNSTYNSGMINSVSLGVGFKY
jgi:opacity protein-like surface antigen